MSRAVVEQGKGLRVSKEAGQLIQCGFEALREAFFRGSNGIGMHSGGYGWSVRAIYEHMECHGRNGLVRKRRMLDLIHELNPAIRHLNVQSCLLCL